MYGKLRGEQRVFKPLVVMGPICSGKSNLINYLKHNHHEFKQVIPYTNRKYFLKDEIEDVDYRKAAHTMFTDGHYQWFSIATNDEFSLTRHY